MSQVSIAACSSLSRPAPCASFLNSVATKFPWSRQYLFLHYIYSVVLSILCRDNLMCVYWNSYVAISTIVSQHCSCAASSNLCRDSISIGSYCNNVSYIVSIPVTTRKVCSDRVLSPLNLISCCSFLLMLRHSLLVLSMFYVATQFLCRDKTSLPCVGIFVAT